MNSISKAAIGIVAAGALFLGGAGIASAADHTNPPKPPLVPKSVINDANKHINDLGPSTRPPARSEDRQVTIAPCTLFKATIAKNHSRALQTRGSGSLTGQGGSSTGCGIPDSATALTVVFNAPTVKGSGSLTWQESGSPKSLRVASFTKKQGMTSAAALQLGVLDPAGKLTAKGSSIAVQISVVGYAIPPIEGMIASDGSIYSGSSRLLSATVLSPGIYKVTTDSDVSNCTPTVNTYSGRGVYGSAYAFAGNSIYVYTWYISGTTHLEVSNSYYFYLNVEC